MLRRILLTLVLLLLLTGTGALLAVRHALEQRGPVLDPPQEAIISDGDALATIAERLKSKKILLNSEVFLALARWRGMDRQVRSGVYDFSGNATAGEVLEALVHGPQRVQLVSIPEGWTVE